MSEKILIEYISTSDKMKADLKELNKVQVDVDNTAKATNKTMAEGFVKTEVKAKSLKQQLKELKTQLQLATDPKEVERLARATGKLSDQIADASDQAKIFASESKFEQVSNAIGSIGSKLLALDFEGAAQQSKLLLAASKSIKFEDAVQGAKDLGTTLLNVGKSIVGSPILMLAATLVAIGIEAYGAAKALLTMNDNTKALTDSIKESEKSIRGYSDRITESYLKIGEALGTITKGQAENKRSEIKNNNELVSIKEKYRADLDAIAKEITGDEKATQASITVAALNGGIQQVATLNKFNRQKGMLDAEFNKQSLKLQATFQADKQNIGIVDNIARAEEAKKANAKLLADANADNVNNLAAAKAMEQKRADDAKFLLDLQTQNISDAFARRKAVLINEFNADAQAHEGNNKILVELQKKLNNELNQVDRDRRKEYLEIINGRSDAAIKAIQDDAKAEADAASDPAFNVNLGNKIKLEIDAEKAKHAELIKLEEQAKQQRQQIQQAAFQTTIALTAAIGQIAQNQFTTEMNNLETQTNEEIASLDRELEQKTISQEEYNLRKTEIEKNAHDEEVKIKKKAFESQKQAAIIGATISMAQGIVAALEAGPAGIALAALAALVGAAQIAVIASQPTPQFATGIVDIKGKGTGTSDSISAMISKGESVITAKETSKHKDLLIAMNKGNGDDYIMKNLIAPALLNQKRKFERSKDDSFADSLMKSISIGSNGMNDGNILNSLKESRKHDKKIADYLVSNLRQRNNRTNPRKF